MNPLLLAIAAIQGRRLRRTVEVLPVASGPILGTAPWPTGSPMRVLILGESTAAGCGAPTHDQAFAGFFARAAAERAGRPVDWQVLGQHGATARRVRHRLLPLLDPDSKHFDVTALLIGVNDVLNRRSIAEWTDDLTAILDTVSGRSHRVVVTGIPPFDVFPSMPGALGRYLARRARLFDRAALALCESRPTVTWISSTDLIPANPQFFARDGFHPSSAGYRQWAKAVGDRLWRKSPTPD